MATKEEIKKVVKALRANNFKPVEYVEKAADAAKMILDMIPVDATIEMAGAVSVSQLGILDQLRKRGTKASISLSPASSPLRR